jgi:hypothetical protein
MGFASSTHPTMTHLTSYTLTLSPYELGKDGFDTDQTHEGDIAQHSKELLKARFHKNIDS